MLIVLKYVVLIKVMLFKECYLLLLLGYISFVCRVWLLLILFRVRLSVMVNSCVSNVDGKRMEGDNYVCDMFVYGE